MFEPMLVACPTFLPAWNQFLAEWRDTDKPYYVALGELADHLTERAKTGDTASFEAVFNVVERWHVDGELYVREAATIGLLEGIQNSAGRRGLDPSVFERWLRPETEKWWARLNRFWDGDALALSEG